MLSRSQQNATLIATILASGMAFIDATAIYVALPAMQQELSLKGSSLLWVVNGYGLFLSALLLMGGSLGDHFGRKKVFILGITIFTGASVLCGLAGSSIVLIASRCVQGIGGALMVPGSLSIISALFPKERRGMAIGSWSMFSAITTIVGPALGGWLAGMGLWRMIFFINVPLALVSLFFLMRVPENKGLNVSKHDIPGAILATLALAGITYGFTEAPDFGFDHPYVYSALTAGILLFIAFLIHERKAKAAMMPLTLFKSKLFTSANSITFFIYAGLGGFLFFFHLNLIQVQEYPAAIAGLTMVPLGILIALLSRWSGQLADKIGPRTPLIIGPMLTAVGFFLFSVPGLTAGPRDFWTTFFPAIAVVGVGMGITVAPLTTTVMNAVGQERTGIASGINNTIARTAGVLAIAIMGSLALITFENSLTSRIEHINLSNDSWGQVRQEMPKLAEAAPPASADPAQKKEIKAAIKLAFIDAFNQSALIATILAGLSVFTTYLFIRK